MNSVLGIICARGGSKRLPGKNLRVINGFSLLERAVITLSESRVNEIVIATDFEPSFDYKRYNAHRVSRPENISGDDTPLQETVKWVYHSLDRHFDFIIFLMPNCPGIQPSDIDACIDMLTGSSKMNVVRSYDSKGHENGIVGVRTKFLLDHFIDVYCGAIIAEGLEIHTEDEYLKVKKELEG